jgi:mono/diheme cytochrome c family protein
MHKFVYGLLIGMCLTPVVGLVAIFLGWTPVQATADPPSWERLLGREAFQSSMARQPKLQNPVQPNSETLRSGLKIYRDNCAGCHGDSGKPSHWGTTGFYPRVPQFDIEPPLVPDWQMFWIVKRGVRYTGMAAWEGEMSDDNIWMVVTFLSHLRNLPPDVQVEWRGQQPSK